MRKPKSARADLLALKNRLLARAEATAIGIVIVDTTGRVVHVNKAACLLLNMEREQLMGQSVLDGDWLDMLENDTYCPLPERPVMHTIRTGEPMWNMTLGCSRQPPDHRRWLKVNAEPVPDSEGTMTEVLVTFWDVTEAVHNQRAMAETEDANIALSALAAISDIIIRETELDSLLPTVLDWVAEILDAETAALLLVEGDEVRLRASVGLEGESPFYKVPVGQGFAGRVSRSNHLLHADYAWSDAQIAGLMDRRQQRAMLGAAVRQGEKTVGVLQVDWPAGRSYSRWEGSLLQLVADRIGAAIVQYRLYDEAREGHRLSDALNRIDIGVNGRASEEDILQYVMEEAAQALRANSAAVVLRNKDRWTVRHIHNLPESILEVSFTEDELPVTEWVMKRQKPVPVEDFEREMQGTFLTGYADTVRACMVIPMITRGQVIGLLSVNEHAGSRVWTEAECDFARKLGTSLTLALENARLFMEQEQARKVLEDAYRREHHIARTLQQAILPALNQPHPSVRVGCAYEAAFQEADIGGDFFDAFLIGNGHVGLLIGDVAGKGLRTAMRSIAARYAIRSYTRMGAGPAQVLKLANEALCNEDIDAEGSLFLTAFFGVFDVHSRMLVFTNGGHEPGLVCRAGDGIEEVYIEGQALGIACGYEYRQSEIRIGPGDRLVLFTDGVTEARKGSDLFGHERVKEFLKGCPQSDEDLQNMAQRLLDKARAFAGGKLQDDAAIVIMEPGKLE